MTTNARPRYWSGPVPAKDDFRQPITVAFYDGRTKQGPWALMNPESWLSYGVGKVGPGCGQHYRKQPDGKWKKVEG